MWGGIRDQNTEVRKKSDWSTSLQNCEFKRTLTKLACLQSLSHMSVTCEFKTLILQYRIFYNLYLVKSTLQEQKFDLNVSREPYLAIYSSHRDKILLNPNIFYGTLSQYPCITCSVISRYQYQATLSSYISIQT